MRYAKDKDTDELIKRAISQGWTVRVANAHIMCYHPNGTNKVLVSTKGIKHACNQARRDFRKNGLEI